MPKTTPQPVSSLHVAEIPAMAAEPLGETRKALMGMLKRAGEMDAASLAKELGVSKVAVRQHLAYMQSAGQLAQRLVRRPVGRPALVYRLTEAAESSFPQSSDRVALDLLARLEKTIGAEALEKLFQARLRDLSKDYAARMAGAKTWEEKLALLAEIRDEEGYLCNVERGADGTQRLIEHHCPVAAIAKQHPQVCRYELELFRRVLGDPKLKRAEHILSGQHACVYESPTKK